MTAIDIERLRALLLEVERALESTALAERVQETRLRLDRETEKVPWPR
jgi:hypothetical protein